jgi:uncharacterized protein YlxW (UPF0749 family)
LEAYNEEMKKVIEELRDTEEELKKLKAERQAYQNSVRNPEETLPLTPLQIGEEEEKKTKNPKKST